MQDYTPVTWNSEPLSLEKLQNMIANDQAIADEIAIRPKGIIGYSELTMYAANVASTGYKAFPSLSLWGNSENNADKVKEWTRVVDNWNINPNGLSVSINTDADRIIHVELYIPLLAHGNPIKPITGSEDAELQWPIQGFKFVRDGVDISAESLVDTWLANGDANAFDPNNISNVSNSLSTSSFYYDCYDINPGAGSHVYEVMWKSDQGIRLEIWDQMRNTFNAEPSAVHEPDQQSYLTHVNYLGTEPVNFVDTMQGRYNISDFVLGITSPQKYTKTELGVTYSTADAFYTADEMWSNPGTGTQAPFAGAIPTAQLVITDCGSASSIIIYKEDGVILQEQINGNPTT